MFIELYYIVFVCVFLISIYEKASNTMYILLEKTHIHSRAKLLYIHLIPDYATESKVNTQHRLYVVCNLYEFRFGVCGDQ